MHLDELLRLLPNWRDAYSRERLPFLDPVPFGAFSDRLITTPPYNVDVVVAVPPSRLDQARIWLPLITFARFRAQYSIIERMAQILAPAILDTGVIPVIEPVHDTDLADVVPDAPWVRRILQRGAVLERLLRPGAPRLA